MTWNSAKNMYFKNAHLNVQYNDEISTVLIQNVDILSTKNLHLEKLLTNLLLSFLSVITNKPLHISILKNNTFDGKLTWKNLVK